jgi:hypothetical protein
MLTVHRKQHNVSIQRIFGLLLIVFETKAIYVFLFLTVHNYSAVTVIENLLDDVSEGCRKEYMEGKIEV